MKRLLLLLLFVFAFLPGLAGASFMQKKIGETTLCLDNQTLNTSQTWLNSTGTTVPISFTTNCTYGCNQIINICHEIPALELSLTFIMILIIFILLFKFIGG